MAERTPNQERYDSIIVLGNSPNWNNSPNVFLKSRLDKAIELFKLNVSNHLILSGAIMNGHLSEAEIMEKYCLLHGIPKTAIFKEEKATSTQQNIIFSTAMIKRFQLNASLVITSNFHVTRTIRVCEKLGVENVEVVSGNNNLITVLTFIPLKLWELTK